MSVQKTGDPDEDLRRAREAGDALRRLLLAAFTGGIAVMLTMAGSLASEGVHPKWVLWPVAGFTLGILAFAVNIYMQETRSLKRRKAAQSNHATVDIPLWMEGRTWTWICLSLLFASVVVAMLAVYSLDMTPQEKTSPTQAVPTQWVPLL